MKWFSWKVYGYFLQNSKLPCKKAPTDEPNKTEGDEETIRTQLTRKELSIEQSPFVICSSEKFQKSISESKCNNPGKLKFVKVSEPKTGIFKLDFVCSECKIAFTISTSDEIIPTSTKPKTYLANYILLSFTVCGQYYKDYNHVLGTLEISHFSKKQWRRVIEWITQK